MKIAIVTQPLGPNLGGIIQNWALQQALKKLGHSPVTINYTDFRPITASRRLRIMARNTRTLLKRCTGGYGRFYKPDDNLPNSCNLQFISRNIIATGPAEAYMPLDGAGAYITGSDQVWRPRYNRGVLTDCFLGFTKDLPVKRISYAASFGTDSWEFTPAQTAECAALLKRFDAVSVRESGAVELCRRHLGCDAMQVPDPTLLLQADDYRPICSEKPIADSYVATYFLDYDSLRRKALKKLCRPSEAVDINPHRSSVSGWLGTIANARAVVTDSFHGAVFSIIFRRPFVVIANPDRGNSRLESLLDELGLRGRLISDPAMVSEAMAPEIDWAGVERILAGKRSQAFEFLTQALE